MSQTIDEIFVITSGDGAVEVGEGWFATEDAARARIAELNDVLGRYEEGRWGDPARAARPGYWWCTLEEYRLAFGGERRLGVEQIRLEGHFDYDTLREGQPAYLVIHEANGWCEDARGFYATRRGAVEAAENTNVARFEVYLESTGDGAICTFEEFQATGRCDSVARAIALAAAG